MTTTSLDDLHPIDIFRKLWECHEAIMSLKHMFGYKIYVFSLLKSQYCTRTVLCFTSTCTLQFGNIHLTVTRTYSLNAVELTVLSYTSSAPPGYDCNEKRFYNTGAWTWTQHSALSTVKWTFKTLKRFAMQWLYNLEKRFKLHDQGANYRIIHNIILYSVDNFGKDTLNIYNNI